MRERRRVARPPQAVDFWPFGGMIAMAATFFLYAVSGIVAPWWATALLLLVWAGVFARACTWWSSHPRRISAAALGLVVLWFAVLVGGAVALDWSA